jgi:hypothetical protein
MPDDAHRNIAAIRENTDRILEILDRDMYERGGAPLGAA